MLCGRGRRRPEPAPGKCAGTDPGLGREGHDRVALSQRRDDGEDSPRRGGPQWRRLDPRGNSFEIISLSSNLNSTGIRKSFTINAHSSSALISVCHRGNLKRPVHDGDGLFCKFGWLDSVEALFTECSSETHDPRRNDSEARDSASAIRKPDNYLSHQQRYRYGNWHGNSSNRRGCGS